MLDCIIKDGEFCQNDAACSNKSHVCMLNSHKYPHCLPKKCRGYLDRITKKKNQDHKKDKKNSQWAAKVKQDLSKCWAERKTLHWSQWLWNRGVLLPWKHSSFNLHTTARFQTIFNWLKQCLKPKITLENHFLFWYIQLLYKFFDVRSHTNF